MYYNNKRLALSVFWVLLGAVLLALSIAGVFESTVSAGMGGALMAVGILQILRIFRYRRNEDYRQRVDTEVRDERNHFLRMKSWTWTGYVVVLAECVGALVAMALGRELIQQLLMYSVCLIVGVYWISYLILSRKY